MARARPRARSSSPSRSALLRTSSRGFSPAPISSSTSSTARMSSCRRSARLGGVDDVQDQVGEHGLLERRLERLDQLVGQLLDEADRVGEQVVAAGELEAAGGRVERVEEPVPHPDLGPGQRVEQRRLAGVGVAGEGDPGQRGAVAPRAHHAAVALEPARAAGAAPRCGRGRGGGRSRSGSRPGPWCRCRRPSGRRRGARGGSRGRACGPCCIRAGRARPGACPRPSGRGRRRCRGSPRCGRSPARPAPPRGCAPGAARARRRRRPGSRRRRRSRPSARPGGRGRSSGRGPAAGAAGSPRPRSRRRRCAAAP